MTSKFLVALLFSIASVLSMQGMNPFAPEASSPTVQGAQDNYVHLLGEQLVNPNGVSLRQKLDKDEAEAKENKEKAKKEAVQTSAHTSHIKKRGTRSLIDELPAQFRKIPAAVWTNLIAPLLEHSKQLLPAMKTSVEIIWQKGINPYISDGVNEDKILKGCENKRVRIKNSKLTITDALLRRYDVQSKEELSEKYYAVLSPNEKFVDIRPHSFVCLSSEDDITNTIYNVATQKPVFEENANRNFDFIFSSDSRYVTYSGRKGKIVLFDLTTKEKYVFEGNKASFSPDECFYVLTKQNVRGSDANRRALLSVETIVIDLTTKKEIIRHESEPIWAYDHHDTNIAFSKDKQILYVQGSFQQFLTETAQQFDPSLKLKYDKVILTFDLARTRTLTLEQSVLLMILDETQKKKDNAPISLLYDIALKRMLSLRELQETLASFHPAIRDGIIKRYRIVDSTPEAYKQHKTQKALENKKYWTNVAKITGFATLVGALAVKWLYSKK